MAHSVLGAVWVGPLELSLLHSNEMTIAAGKDAVLIGWLTLQNHSAQVGGCLALISWVPAAVPGSAEGLAPESRGLHSAVVHCCFLCQAAKLSPVMSPPGLLSHMRSPPGLMFLPRCCVLGRPYRVCCPVSWEGQRQLNLDCCCCLEAEAVVELWLKVLELVGLFPMRLLQVHLHCLVQAEGLLQGSLPGLEGLLHSAEDAVELH